MEQLSEPLLCSFFIFKYCVVLGYFYNAGKITRIIIIRNVNTKNYLYTLYRVSPNEEYCSGLILKGLNLCPIALSIYIIFIFYRHVCVNSSMVIYPYILDNILQHDVITKTSFYLYFWDSFAWATSEELSVLQEPEFLQQCSTRSQT